MLDINDTLRVSRRASREDDAVTRTSKGKSFHARLGGSCPSGSSRSFRVSLASHPSPMSACLSTAGGRNFATCRTVPFPRARSSLFSLSLSPPLSFSSIHDPSREFEISSEEMRAKLARRDVSQRIESTLGMNLSMIIKPGLFTTKCRLRLCIVRMRHFYCRIKCARKCLYLFIIFTKFFSKYKLRDVLKYNCATKRSEKSSVV